MNLHLIKRIAIALGAAVIAVGTPMAALAAGYSPANRPTYIWSGATTKAADHVVFNSFTNMPGYGDERIFFTAAPGTSTTYKNVLGVTPGQELTLQVYVHNNADASLNASGKGIAKNTRVRIAIPTSANSSLPVTSYISADNANNQVKDANGAVNVVADTLNLNNSSVPVSISYVPGSAVLKNGAHTSGIKLSDAIVGSTGTQIGYETMNGLFPACSHYRATITIKVKVNIPAITLKKQITIPGSPEWQDSLIAAPGNTVSWKLTVGNPSKTNQLTNITLFDKLPAHVQLVPGSVTYVDNRTPNGIVLPDTVLFTTGYKLPVIFAPETTGYVRYRTTVSNDFAAGTCDATILNQGKATATGVQPVYSNATAKITINCATTPTPLPSTGAGVPAAGGALGLTGLGYAGIAYVRSRKGLVKSLRK